MKLSVIIVSYNVRFFLEQCLISLRRAIGDLPVEVFVVDNHSVDGSAAMVRKKFPEIKLIENRSNLGFSKANNQAIRQSTGEYLLLLNPDTLVEEDTLTRCLQYMDSRPEAGALGVKMIDGKGRYLPESKRAFPTPLVSLFKLSGLTRLFPRSRTFGKYYLGHLDPDRIHDVDVLTGAFMLIRHKVLEETGLLDEDYFMYGEDIDLSYRIQQAGFRVVYFPETTIIHYKGESTRKSSLNYVLLFYRAMLIFARKHLVNRKTGFFNALIRFAIWFRAGLSILRRFLSRASLPLIDFLLILAGFRVLVPAWERIRFPEGGSFPHDILLLWIPAAALIWVTSIWLAGGYDKPVKLKRIMAGAISGSLVVLVSYALLPEHLRFSRLLILSGSLWTILLLPLYRFLLDQVPASGFRLASDRKKKIVIAGTREEASRVFNLLARSRTDVQLAGILSPSPTEEGDYLGSPDELEEVVRVHGTEEVIFCARDIPAGRIIEYMNRYARLGVEFKIAPPESYSVVGSNSIHTTGDLYLMEFKAIATPASRRNKRLLDLGFSLAILTASPILFIIYRKPGHFIKNILTVIIGKKSWVGYHPEGMTGEIHLPAIRPGVLYPLFDSKEDAAACRNANLLYAKDYRLSTDIRLIRSGLKQLDS